MKWDQWVGHEVSFLPSGRAEQGPGDLEGPEQGIARESSATGHRLGRGRETMWWRGEESSNHRLGGELVC